MSSDMQIIQLPPGLKIVTEVYLVQLEVKGKLAVVLAFDREDAELKEKEVASYVNQRRVTVLGPFKVA